MPGPTREQLLQIAEQLEMQIKLLKKCIKDIKPEKEWLTTAEFAERSGLTLHTVSTYCGAGRFDRCRKNDKGYWEIHKSELPT